jgi:cytochrome c heme-lyase
LIRFQGKPKDYTIKARLRQLLGYQLPFDRHDWIVDRCGEQVRYIIDFYTGDQKAGPLSFYLDVRPAPTISGIYARLKMFLQKREW